MRKYHVLTLDHIAEVGLHRFPATRYSVGRSVDNPDAILVRSHDMHAMTIPGSVRAISRAGVGVNNIPVAEMSKRGTPVFNTRVPTPMPSRSSLWRRCCSQREI